MQSLCPQCNCPSLPSTLAGRKLLFWYRLPKRVTIKDLQLLEANYYRHLVQWKVHNTTKAINLPHDDFILNCHQISPQSTPLLHMLAGVELENGIEVIDSGKDVAVGSVVSMLCPILDPYLSNHMVDVETAEVRLSG